MKHFRLSTILISTIISSTALADDTVICHGSKTVSGKTIVSQDGTGILKSDGLTFQATFPKKKKGKDLSQLHLQISGDYWPDYPTSQDFTLDTVISDDSKGTYSAASITFTDASVAKASLARQLFRGVLSILTINHDTKSGVEFRIDCDPLPPHS